MARRGNNAVDRLVACLSDRRVHIVELSKDTPTNGAPRITSAVVEPAVTLGVDGIADAIQTGLGPHGGRRRLDGLVLPLDRCFCHCLDDRRASRQALIFALEEYLPVPIEQVTCAFARLDRRRVLGVAVPTAPLKRLLDCLSGRGVDVDHVTVDVVAVALETDDPPSVVIRDDVWCRGIDRHDEGAAETWTLPTTLILRERELFLHSDDARCIEGTARRLDIRAAPDSTDNSAFHAETAHERVTGDDAVAAIARAALRTTARFDLRTGALEPPRRWAAVSGLGQQCLAASLALLLVWTVAMQRQSHQLSIRLATVRADQLEVYREVFAAPTLPPGAAMRLASERLRLEALTRRQSMAGDADESQPLDTLRDLVANLPADVRILLNAANVDWRQLTLRGQTAEHGDAERIAAAVNAVEGWRAHPPRTTRLRDGGVEFSLLASFDPQAPMTDTEAAP